MQDPTATPWFVVLLLLLCPVGVVLALGALAFRRLTPLVFHCRRCDRDFLRPPHRRFPTACPRCGAHDWNAARD